MENRTRYIALANALAFLGISLGSLAGGLIAPYLPLIKGSYFLSIFLVSGISRLLVVALFFPRISEVRDVKAVSIREMIKPDMELSYIKGIMDSLAARFRKH
jgi:MFS family permease